MILRFLGPFFCTLFAATGAYAQASDMPLLEENFAYPAGALADVSGGQWKSARGESAIAARDGGVSIPGEAAAENYLTRAFAAAPAGSAIEATFRLRFDPGAGESAAAGEAGVFFQFTSADGKQRRGRIALRLAADGTARLGVTSRASGDVTWADQELAPAEDHTVRLRYDGVVGRTSLWINPSAATGDTPPAAESTDAGAVAPARVSLQQSARPGAPDLRLADLVVRNASSGAVGGAAVAASASPEAAKPAAPGVTPPPADRFHVFLLIGQSNMAGRGVPEPEDLVSDPRILARQLDGRWVVARDPLHWDKPHAAGVGPGLSFARELLRSLPADASIGLIPAAFGGTGIAWWQKNYDGPQRWSHGETYYRHALAAARAAAAQGRLAGILWNQGENDQGRARADGGESYRRQLHALIRDLRADLAAPDLPFVAATLGPWHAEKAQVFNATVLALPNDVPHTAVVDTLAADVVGRLANKPGDPAHYDTPSNRLLGRLYARELLPLLSR